MEANEPSLKDRREKLSLQFGIKRKSNRSNPTYNTVFRPNFFSLFEKKPNAIPIFGIRIAPALTAAGIKVRNIRATSVIDTPPWTLNKPEVNFSLAADKKDNTDAFIFKTKFQEITSHYPDFKHIYTDGSKDGPKVAAACVSRTQTRKCRLPDNASIFSAESQALNKLNKWQLVWNTAVDNKLHSIKSILGEWRPAFRTDRKEEVVLARLRIGHSFITHSYLLKGEEQPTCVPCDTPFTIKHILLHCVDF